MIHVNILQNITYDALSFSLLCRSIQLSSYLHRIPRQKFEHYFCSDVTHGSAYSLSSEQTIQLAKRKIVVRHWKNFHGFLMKVMRNLCDRSFDSFFFPDSSISSLLSSWQCDVVLSLSRRSILLFFRLLGFFIKLWEPSWISRKYRDVLTLQAGREE